MAVKKCRSVACNGLSFFRQVNFGRGEPLAMHSSTIESPTIISLFSIGFTNDGFSEKNQTILYNCPETYSRVFRDSAEENDFST